MGANVVVEKGERTVDDIRVKPTNADYRYAQALRAQREIERINEILSDGSTATSLRFEGQNAKEVVALLSKRRNELRALLSESRPAIRYAQTTSTATMKERPLIMGQRDLSFDMELLRQVIAQQQTMNCSAISIGQVRATDFRLYGWNNPNVAGASGSYAYWPRSQVNQFAQDTYSGNWTGEVGAYFWTWITVPGKWWALDPIDSIAGAAVLQFTIPAPQCDAMLYWGTWGIAEAVTNWHIDADWGRIDSDWLLHESPDGGDFPASLTEDFQFIASGLYKSTQGSTESRDATKFERSFPVRAGASPRIYLGCSVMAMAKDGQASTIKFGVGDNFRFEYGVTYIMVSPPA